MAYHASGLKPSPRWLASTSMFSCRGPGFSTLHCHATMPSVRLKMEVVGTGGGMRRGSWMSAVPMRCPVTFS